MKTTSKKDERYIIIINDQNNFKLTGQLNELYSELEEGAINESILIQNENNNENDGWIWIKIERQTGLIPHK